jgi:hypothetical protein
MPPRALLSALLFALVACASPAGLDSVPQATGPEASASPAQVDPSRAEVELEGAANGWRATLVVDNGETGIWTVEAFQVFEQYASPEVVGLDDLGRCNVFVSYSGKWTPLRRIGEGEWLGGLAHGDIDPRTAGAELYTGGKQGNLYQLRAYAHGGLDARLIAHFPGRELHTLVGGDFDPRSPGAELLVFAQPGALYRVSPTGPDGSFESELLEVLPGRVRDALVLPSRPGEVAEIATVSRAGELNLLRIDAQGPHWRTIYKASMGLGRVALRPGAASDPVVLYTTHDDGRVLRHERAAGDAWTSELIFAGPQGPRGVVAGRFDADPLVETIAVFGYSKQVQILSRRDGQWSAQTIFADRDKGHWLAVAELDGRNGTAEIIGSGYGARIFMLSRPAGYGRPGVALEPVN